MTILVNLRKRILEENLTHCEIPDSVTEIAKGAFYGCTGLTSINIPNSVKTIGDMAFTGCSSLTSITLPDSVTAIGEGAFYRCTGLTSISLPSSIESIGYGAFATCTSLKYIISSNPAADKAQKERWGIPNDCQIISPEDFCQQEAVTKVLRNITDDHLTSEQIIFLYMNRHRWAQLTLQELQTHLGEAPVALLQQIQHPLCETVSNGLGVLTKASLFSQENTSLTPGPSLDVSCSGCKIKDALIAQNLVKVAKPEQSVKQIAEPAPAP